MPVNNLSISRAVDPMRISQPRIPPLADDQLTQVQFEALVPARARSLDGHNVFRTLVNHPELTAALLPWGGYILNGTTMSPRETELLILRVGWRCQAEYEWSQHRLHGMEAGLTAEEIETIKLDPAKAGWNDRDSTLLRVADELIDNHFISDSSWAKLAQHYDRCNCMDIVFIVGQYVTISMALNSFGVQLDEGMSGF